MLAGLLVEERLAACCSILPSVRSVYRWKGAVERADECLLLCKTRRDLFDALKARVLERHSYEVPEIFITPVVGGYGPYLDWLAEETLPALSSPAPGDVS
jgi:periplasmic divalent cation tolerance protein